MSAAELKPGGDSGAGVSVFVATISVSLQEASDGGPGGHCWSAELVGGREHLIPNEKEQGETGIHPHFCISLSWPPTYNDAQSLVASFLPPNAQLLQLHFC